MKTPLVRLLCAFLVGAMPAVSGAANAVTPEDVAVLRAALAPECERSGTGYHLLSTKPAGVDSDDHVPADWPEAKELDEKLRARAETPGSWSGIRVCPKVLVRREGDIDRLIDSAPDLDRGWKNFYDVYRGAHGVLYISLPAYSADGNRAVIVYGSGCGSLCGYGQVIELEKKDGTWHRVRDQGTWIS